MAHPIPTLETARLVLRPLEPADAPVVERLAGAPEVALVTANIPHPYPPGLAATWISGQRDAAERGGALVWGITRREGGELLGAITLVPHGPGRAETGYWLGLPYWNRGFMSEAAGAVVRHAFTALRLHRVQATHYPRNPASGRVMEKVGMRREGLLRGYARREGVYEDVVMYGVLQTDLAG